MISIGLGDQSALRDVKIKSLYGEEVVVDSIPANEIRTIHFKTENTELPKSID